MTLTVVSWNIDHGAGRWSERAPEILRRINQHSPEIVCLTEADNKLLSGNGYSIWPQPYYGYPIKPNHRRVLLWSRQPWRRVDWWGKYELPPGRFISGVTQTSIGQVTVIGVCIPWGASRTQKNRGNRAQWQDHEQYLHGLTEILKNSGTKPLIVMGDFNQQIGQGDNPYPSAGNSVRKKLATTMQAGDLTIATSALGFHGKENVRRAIDHIAISNDLSAEALCITSNWQNSRRDLSDHFGVVATLSSHK